MAEVQFGFGGGISGKFGDFVFYRMGGKTYMRRRPRRKVGACSERQEGQRSKLAGAMVMYRFVRESVLAGVFAAWAREVGARSGYNLFLSRNMNAFGAECYVDYGLLTFSGGGLQLPNELAFSGLEGRKASFAWINNTAGTTARGDDRLLAAVVTDDEPYRVVAMEETEGTRQDGTGSVALPEGPWTTAHAYLFFGTSDGSMFSPSVYFKIVKP